MTIDELLIVLFLVMLAISFARDSSLFLIFAGIMLLVVAAKVDSDVLNTQSQFIRYGTFTLLVLIAIVLFVQGALHFREELSKA